MSERPVSRTQPAKVARSNRSHCQETLPGVTARSPGVTVRSHCQESLPGDTARSPGVTTRSHCQESLPGDTARSPGVTTRSHCQESLPGVTARSHCQECPGVTVRSHCQESLPGVQESQESLPTGESYSETQTVICHMVILILSSFYIVTRNCLFSPLSWLHTVRVRVMMSLQAQLH